MNHRYFRVSIQRTYAIWYTTRDHFFLASNPAWIWKYGSARIWTGWFANLVFLLVEKLIKAQQKVKLIRCVDVLDNNLANYMFSVTTISLMLLRLATLSDDIFQVHQENLLGSTEDLPSSSTTREPPLSSDRSFLIHAVAATLPHYLLNMENGQNLKFTVLRYA